MPWVFMPPTQHLEILLETPTTDLSSGGTLSAWAGGQSKKS